MQRIVTISVYAACLLTIVFLQWGVMCIAGDSMEYAFRRGDYVIVNRFGWWGNHAGLWHRPVVRRGNIVVCKAPGIGLAVKRVVGLPGDTVRISNGVLYVNEAVSEQYPSPRVYNAAVLNWPAATVSARPITIPKGRFFVLGDNRSVSNDSRAWGPISAGDIVADVIGWIQR